MRGRRRGIESTLRGFSARGTGASLRCALCAAAFAALCLVSDAPARGQDEVRPAPSDRTRAGAASREKEQRSRKTVNRPPGPRAELDLAAGYIRTQQYDKAIAVLEGLTAEFPQIAEATEMLSSAYLKAGRPREAAALLEGVLAKEPDRYAAIRDLGLAYLDMGEKEKAVGAWRRLLRNDSRYGAFYGVVAKLEQEGGLYDEAIETLREGLAFAEYRESYAREIIHLERVRGHEEDAFREALLYAGQRGEGAGIDIRDAAIQIFNESKSPARLLAIADSLIGTQGGGGEGLRHLRVVFLVNEGRYAEASAELFGKGAAKPSEEDFYSLLQYWAAAGRARNDERFAAFYEEALRAFLREHGDSFLAPSVMLMMASDEREVVGRGGASAERSYRGALALVDQAMQHRQGAPYREPAALFKATVLFEDLHEPNEALAQLDRTVWRNEHFAREAAELRMRALLASADWPRAEQGLERLAAAGDSTTAVVGRYGLGRMKFLSGRYGEAVSSLSALAERYPWSAWANDALETAIALKESMEDRGALELYRAASLAGDRGEYGRALDSLAALEDRFAGSKLAPRARFMRADLEVALGDTNGARDDLARLAETFPLHELAPRALERIADMAGRRSPDGAMKEYGVIIERYPDYAFLERVREKYIALGKAAAADEAGAAKKGGR